MATAKKSMPKKGTAPVRVPGGKPSMVPVSAPAPQTSGPMMKGGGKVKKAKKC